MKPTIKILDSIHSKANAEARNLILPYLEYKSVFYKRTTFGKKQNIEAISHLITGRNGTGGTFYTGLIPYIKKQAKQDGIELSIIGKIDKITPLHKKPKLKGVTFRDYQYKAIKKFIRKQRGRVIIPTQAGKTFIACGIIHCFLNLRILFLQHTTDLLKQNSEELTKCDIDHQILGGKNKVDWEYLQTKDSFVLLSTIQSLAKVPKEYWSVLFDFLIVDELHHATKEKSQYGMIMQNCLAPLRLGLTATDPTEQYQKLVSEGFFGPILMDMSNKEGVDTGVLAKPIINLVPVPYETKIVNKCDKKYKLYQKYGISRNKSRNKLIVSLVQESLDNNEIVLIIVENLEHGNILKKMLGKKNIQAPFVQGMNDKDFNSKIKELMRSSEIKVCICSKIWGEGISIHTLNHVILACGMKERKKIKQAVGRGQSKKGNKQTIKLSDMLDPYRYLAEHAIQRIQIYKEEGWL
ncbi:MAG: DEAD/DEAH box helicase family protein [Nitrosarchaeum sp.]